MPELIEDVIERDMLVAAVRRNIAEGQLARKVAFNPARRVRIEPFDINWDNGLGAGPVMVDAPQAIPKPKQPKADKNQPFTLGGYLGKVLEGTFGIEIEVEGKNSQLPKGVPVPWVRTNDGSLRGEAAEYILQNPLPLEKAVHALQQLNLAFVAQEAQLDFSFRTSVHVHVNMLDFTKDQILSFMYLSSLMEEHLVRYSGAARVGNRFCLRLKDAEYKLERMKAWIKGSLFNINFHMDKYKYSAINFSPLIGYGSIEFRSMRGTTDENVLIPWLQVLDRMRAMAKEASIQDIAKVAKESPSDLLDAVFKEHRALFAFTNELETLAELRRMLIELPYIRVG